MTHTITLQYKVFINSQTTATTATAGGQGVIKYRVCAEFIDEIQIIYYNILFSLKLLVTF